jgi:hypothetical protein
MGQRFDQSLIMEVCFLVNLLYGVGSVMGSGGYHEWGVQYSRILTKFG